MGADSIVLGPPTAAQCYGTEGIILDQTNSNLYVFGASRTPKLLAAAAALGPQTALTAITTAQALLSNLFGAGALNRVGATVQVSGTFLFTTAGTTQPTLTIALTLGGVTLCTITSIALSATAGTNLIGYFQFTLTVVTAGAAGTIESHGLISVNVGTTGSQSLDFVLDGNTGVSAAVNLLVADTLTVTIAASSTVTSAQLRQAIVQQIA